MITLTELKLFLGIESSENDTLLNGCINSAIAILNSECNRKFERKEYTEYYYDNMTYEKLYLRNTPIVSLTSVQYYDGEEYTNLFSSPDTLQTSFEVRDAYLYGRLGYNFYSKDIKVVYEGGYKFIQNAGTVTITAGSTALTGTNTTFTTDAAAGDFIIIGGEKIEIESITTNTALVLSSPINEDYNAAEFVITTLPEDIRQAIIDLASEKYYNSGQGLSLLVKESESMNSGASSSTNYKTLDMLKLFDKYRYHNI